MVPTFVTAHAFCASRDTLVNPIGGAYKYRDLQLCRERRTYQVMLVSKKKIGGYHAFFRDNKASIYLEKKNAIHCFVFYCFFFFLEI